MSKFVNRLHVINLDASFNRVSKKVAVSAEAITAAAITNRA